MIVDDRDKPSRIKNNHTEECGEPKIFTYRECWNEDEVVPDDGCERRLFNLTTTNAFPFMKSSETSFKEGYLCAMEVAKNSFCGNCGHRFKFKPQDYDTRKSALHKVEFMKSAAARDLTKQPQLNYNGDTGLEILHLPRAAPRLIRNPK